MITTSPERSVEIAAFLSQQGWDTARVDAFDGDFSPRRYARLTKTNNHTAILMDADRTQKTPQFITVANILRQNGINVPEIYIADAACGLVLMEDFGTRNVGRLLDNGATAQSFLLNATEVLAQLHHRFDLSCFSDMHLPRFNTHYFVDQATLFLDAYFPYIKKRSANEQERQDFQIAWQTVLQPLEAMPKSLVLRDFITDNLMDLSNGTLGVLDFQDAGIGCIAYDLASLVDEVRRDGAFMYLSDIIDRYRVIRTNLGVVNLLSHRDLTRACTILSAQRHTRTLGNVIHTALVRGQGQRFGYTERIERHLSRILQESYLIPVREWMDRYLTIQK